MEFWNDNNERLKVSRRKGGKRGGSKKKKSGGEGDEKMENGEI